MIREHGEEYVNLLIEAKADVNIGNDANPDVEIEDRMTPLMNAVRCAQCVNKLIQGRADMNDIDCTSYTALMGAVHSVFQ